VSPSEKDVPNTFRITFWRPWLLAVAILAVPALVVAGALAISGQFAAAAVVAGGLAVIAALLALPIGWMVGSSRWDVDAAGIGGRDNWNVYRRVGWHEIRSVSRVSVPGYPHVWLSTADRRRAIWVPLFLSNMAGFRAAVARYASPDNPLRQLLDRTPA
jgi:hypothetical protein